MADGTTIQIDAQSTDFLRSGVTTQTVSHSPGSPPGISVLIGNYPAIIKPTLTRGALVGMDTLASIYGVSPFSLGYENNTNDLYTRTLGIARSMAQTGPVNVRGGTVRQAYELADVDVQTSINRFRELWQVYVAWSGVVVQAADAANRAQLQYDGITLHDNEQSIMAQHANAQSAVGFYSQVNASNQAVIQAYAASRHYGTLQMQTTEDLQGAGMQNGTVSGFGMSSWR